MKKNLLFAILVIFASVSFINCTGRSSSESSDEIDTLRYGKNKCDVFISEITKQGPAEEKLVDYVGNSCVLLWFYAPSVDSLDVDFGMIEVVKKISKADCVGYYVSSGVKDIVFNHKQYGTLNYENRMNLEPGYAYKCVLMDDNIDNITIPSVSADELADLALEKLNEGNFKLAFQMYKESASRGSKYAFTNLGFMYDRGEGTHIDYCEAAKWYKKAAENGEAIAQYNYAIQLLNGQGVKCDPKEAAIWFEKAADQGNADAQENLGVMYVLGQGIPKDEVKGTELIKKAAEAGNKFAQFNLYVNLHDGIGIAKNISESYKWLKKSAEQGHSEAESVLGTAYAEGDEIECDYDKAVMYFQRAAAKGLSDAYNGLAYCYAEGQGVEKDMDKAIEMIDNAIMTSSGTQKIFYMDSKGEFYLMMHKEEKAKDVWKEMEKLDKKYVESELPEVSVLYKYIKSGENPY